MPGTDRVQSQAGDGAPHSIALVDDHRLFLMGFSLLLERIDPPCIVEPYDTPVELLRALEDGASYHLVICDLAMRRMNGLAFLSALRARRALPVLMISGITTSPPLAEMRQLGARGFVHKSADDDDLVAAIEAVLAGGEYFPESAGNGAASPNNYGDVREPLSAPGEVPALTERQLEILHLISNGASNKEIARALSISENTVKTHLRQLFEVLNVTKRTACVRAAQSLGIL